MFTKDKYDILQQRAATLALENLGWLEVDTLEGFSEPDELLEALTCDWQGMAYIWTSDNVNFISNDFLETRYYYNLLCDGLGGECVPNPLQNLEGFVTCVVYECLRCILETIVDDFDNFLLLEVDEKMDKIEGILKDFLA